MPTIVNNGQDPFERTPSLRAESTNDSAWGYGNTFLGREFWRFVLVQQRVTVLAQTAVEYPPMQAPASFNLEAVKAKVQDAQQRGAIVGLRRGRAFPSPRPCTRKIKITHIGKARKR